MRVLTPIGVLLALSVASGCNDIPEGHVVAIEPEAPTTDDELRASIVTEAVDKHEVTYRYQWSVDGAEVAEQTGETVPASETAKGQVWSVSVVPNDGKVDGAAAEAEVTVQNTPPTATVAVAPLEPKTVEDLVASVETDDADGETVTVRFAWRVDGAATSETGDTVPSASTSKGETWEVTAIPNDGEADGQPVTASVLVGNEPPVADSVTLAPTVAYVTTEFSAAAAGSDVDGDALTWTYTWFIDGAQAQTGPAAALSGVFTKGQSVRVEAVANDGVSDSNTVTSDAVTVLNTRPVLESASVLPADPVHASVLSCQAGPVTDADGDSVNYTTTWNVDGVDIGESETLDNTSFSKGQPVICTLTPFDGEEEGDAVSSAPVEIGNTPPVLASVAITPDPARTADSLSVVPSGVSDVDGDPVIVDYIWTVNGTVASTTSSLDASEHVKGDVVEVTATPFDGTDSGTEATAVLTVQNTPPTAASVAIDPSDAFTTDDLWCEITSGSTDADDDRFSYRFEWVLDGTAWTSSTTTTVYAGDTIDSSQLADGDEWSCAVIANDGTDDSAAGVSTTLTIAEPLSQVRDVSGTWLDVDYRVCGSGTTCTATDAKRACSAFGQKVVSHASDGTTDVYSLGASSSCFWDTSYFTIATEMGSGDCLVGVSNLEWSSCCGTTTWHGNTLAFAKPGRVFGYVRAADSGYVSSYPNVSGTTWGCVSEATGATVPTSCTTLYVACY